MAGYRRSRTVKLVWADDHELAGLEVRARRASIGQMREIAPLLEGSFSGLSEKDIDDMAELLLTFGGWLVSWNLQDEDGTPVPCTAAELVEQDIALVTAIVQAWAEHIAGVPAPLGGLSASGDPSLEASLPMDVSSESPPS